MNIYTERIRSYYPVYNEFLCSICSCLLWTPVECNNCHEIFCEQCVKNRLKEKLCVCPSSCKDYEEIRCSRRFCDVLYRFDIECENKNHGCNDVLPYQSLEEHCLYKMMICRGCQKNILRRDLEEHEQKCDEIQIDCNECHLKYKQKEKHDQMDCILYRMDQNEKNFKSSERENEKKFKSLEREIENLQQCLQEVQTNTNSYSIVNFLTEVVHDILLTPFLSSWNIIYDFPYNHVTTVEELRALKSQCKDQIIVGAIQGSSSVLLKIAAMGPADILLLDSPLNQPTKYGNIHWYLTPGYSFGFAPSSTTVACDYADYDENDNSNNRLSWCLNNNGGYRAGDVVQLNNNTEWRKIIMTQKD